ncbi:MAG: ABC transporter permease subunit [Actinomycetes bacterium]
MLSSVMTKTLRDQRRALLIWSVSLVLLVGMYAAFYPSIKGDAGYSDLIARMPESMRALFTAGGGGDLGTGEGFLYMELLSFMGPMIILGYTISAGTSVLAGEEAKRTFDLLLTAPVSRARVLLEKSAAVAVVTVVLMVVLGLAVQLEGAAVGMGLAPSRVAAAMLHLGLLGLEFGALAILIAAATGRLALSWAIPAAVAVLAYVLNGIAPLVSWLEPYRNLSPFYYYIGHDPIRSGVWLPGIAVMVISIAIMIAVAIPLFRRRDIAG